jgi:hypothetical protein
MNEENREPLQRIMVFPRGEEGCTKVLVTRDGIEYAVNLQVSSGLSTPGEPKSYLEEMAAIAESIIELGSINDRIQETGSALYVEIGMYRPSK